jgi:glycosyltransferase involved in cell wall biosynthesis
MISVITCTHNPRDRFLSRVNDSLHAQTLDSSSWEWIIVDNFSKKPVSSWLDISWHRYARIIVEPELGLTPARLRGMHEAKHEHLVFVDDDNALDPEYLQNIVAVFSKHQNLGAIGGVTEGDFSVPAPRWFTTREFEMLGIRSLESDRWGRSSNVWDICPIGAGLAIRRAVAIEYCRQLGQESGGSRRKLDRCGESLVSAGDIDLALTSFSLGLGVGRFCSLRLVHLIPEERTRIEYLERLARGIGYSGKMLQLQNASSAARGSKRWFMRIPFIRRIAVWLGRSTHLKRIDRAYAAGEEQAISEWVGGHE